MATPVGNAVPLAHDALIDGLVQGGAWQFGGGAHTLTYSLSLNDTPVGGAWTSPLATAFRSALAVWANVANLSFAETGSGGVFTASPADMAALLTGNELQTSVGAASLGIFPDPGYANTLLTATEYTRTTYPRPEGDVALDNYYPAFSSVSPGGQGFLYMVHEIGHALGLKHPHDDGGNGRPTFSALGITSYDNTHFTVMSYNPGDGVASGNVAATPMLLDILAIQRIYGANTTYHSGDDTYAFQSYDNTIWDTGGTDTLDASARFGSMRLDLRAGELSRPLGFGSDVVTAIAYGVTIENVIGSPDADTIIGNDADNRIDGGTGGDTMSGGPGSDVYVVRDVVFGIPSMNDTVNESPNEGTDTVELAFTVTGTYTLPANVENLTQLGTTGIGLFGNALDNVITAHAVGAGTDDLRGGAGNDTYILGSGTELMTENAGAGTDTVRSAFTFTLPDHVEILVLTGSGNVNGTGSAQANTINGNSGNNAIAGGAGNDRLAGAPDPLTLEPSFGTWRDWTSGVTTSDRAVDVNGDHRADLVQFGREEVSVALSSGAAFGTWTPWTSGITASDQVIDLNADGNADLLQIWHGRAIAALSTGSGFGPWRDWTTGATATDRAVDVNGDGRADLAQFGPEAVMVALSSGTAFGPWAQWATGITAADQIIDLDADGNADLLQLWHGRAIVALSNGSGFGAWSDWTTGVTSGDLASDINGDHKADLLQFGTENVRVAMSTGTAFGPWRTGAGGITQSDKTVDVDGDGSSDLLQFWHGRAIVALATPAGSGDDVLTGGADADTFVFETRFGHDRIADFQPGTDVIELARASFSNFAAVMAHTADDGSGNTVITYDTHDSVTLTGVAKASLSAGDFLFV